VEGGICSPIFAFAGVTKALLFFLEIQNCLVHVLEEESVPLKAFVVFTKRRGAPEIENAEDMMMITFDRSMF